MRCNSGLARKKAESSPRQSFESDVCGTQTAASLALTLPTSKPTNTSMVSFPRGISERPPKNTAGVGVETFPE